jgi:NlpC/P60 family putative phage cell wall peptidase
MSGGRTADAVVAAALGWLGTPYRHQASRKGVGCDCLGLVLGVWRELYGAPPETPGPYAPDWSTTGQGDPLMEAAQRHCGRKAGEPAAGELVLFRWKRNLPARHAGIMVAPDRFIHAYEGHAVLVSPLVPQWRRRIAGVFAFPEVGTGSGEKVVRTEG